MADDFDDIGADIKAAYESSREEPEGVIAPASIPDPAKPPEAPVEAKEAPPRAPDGKFAAKPAEPAEPVVAAPVAAPDAETINPPASWSATAKADFKSLPPHIQQEVLRRERDMDKGLAERAEQLKRYKPYDDILGPHRERLALSGTDETAYLRSLITADEMLRDPSRRVQAIGQIAQMYGINLGQAPQQGQLQPQLPPELQGLFQKVSTLEQTLQQRDTAAETARQNALQSEIQSFAAKPEHLYFENVKPMMAALLQSEQAKDLSEAYDMACMANPEVRTLILRDQEAQRSAKAAEDARAKAVEAKRSGGSVTGSPGIGVAPGAVNQNSSIEDDVRAAFAGSGRV